MDVPAIEEWRQAIFADKARLGMELSRLPFEEKLERLKKLQKLAREIAAWRERERKKRRVVQKLRQFPKRIELWSDSTTRPDLPPVTAALLP
ncbi:MAG: hypothetical protein NZ959_02720 [Armatimonadetes bacterium]|nr:hypothetical protein [Armatimonadota bacterium]MDW8121507.1 hypothetical protein [Armatimonadota bacterium]